MLPSSVGWVHVGLFPARAPTEKKRGVMGSLGFPELLVILVIVLLVFGGGKLPGIGDALGRSIRNFKKAATGDEDAPPPPPTKTPTNTPSA